MFVLTSIAQEDDMYFAVKKSKNSSSKQKTQKVDIIYLLLHFRNLISKGYLRIKSSLVFMLPSSFAFVHLSASLANCSAGDFSMAMHSV